MNAEAPNPLETMTRKEKRAREPESQELPVREVTMSVDEHESLRNEIETLRVEQDTARATNTERADALVAIIEKLMHRAHACQVVPNQT